MNPSPEQQDKMIKRLARIEGQLRGVQKLIHDGQDCEKILQQMTASRKALDKAFFEMISCLVEVCVLDPQVAGTAEQQVAEIRSLLSRYA
ncbi:MAG: metal-sensitive transcriptional regulator [Alcanivoracaceae bacterium]|jgi:DNA-binding FrmR family transcriptional regulator|nr:metal-sensitive transcriptional regulator [Alcanivoracaceae bacterium]